MGSNATENVGKQNFPAFPSDQNSVRPSVLVGAIVDPITKEVTGYLPLSVVDNGDGTCTLKTTT